MQEVTCWVDEAGYRIGKEACSRAKGLVLVGDLQGGEEICADECYGEPVKPIGGLSDACDKCPDYDAAITVARRSLATAKKSDLEWNCGRKGESKKKVDELSKGNGLGKIMAISSTPSSTSKLLLHH